MATVLVKIDLSPEAMLVLTDPWLLAGSGSGGADTLYLRLDATNDPLTGTLSTQALVPSADNTYDFGSATLRYKDLYGAGLQVVAGTLGAATITRTAGSTIIASAIKASGSTTTITAQAATALNSALVLGTATSASTGAAVMQATGDASLIAGLCRSASTGSATITASGAGSTILGRCNASSTTAVATMTANNVGCAVIGNCSAQSSATTADMLATASGSFVQGAAISAGGLSSKIEAPGSGGFAQGTAQAGTITASGVGAMARGYCSQSGAVLASGNGSLACGLAQGSGLVITASAQGAVALGDCQGAGSITASGLGSFAQGSSLNGAIVASATNSAQFGPGTNAEADTLKVGTAGIRLKGTVGAPGTPVNGDQYLGGAANAFVVIQSNAKAVQINTGAAAWTVGAYATQRNITTRTGNFGGTALTPTAPGANDFTIQAMTNIAPFGFANANEGDTLVNAVSVLQTQVLELWQVIETLVEELQAANHIN